MLAHFVDMRDMYPLSEGQHAEPDAAFLTKPAHGFVP